MAGGAAVFCSICRPDLPLICFVVVKCQHASSSNSATTADNRAEAAKDYVLVLANVK